MSGASRLGLLPVVLATLGSMAPVAWAAWPSDPTVNVPLCALTGTQDLQMIVSDGAGGAIVTWLDVRSGTRTDIYAQRVNPAGVPLWTTNGVALCTAPDLRNEPMIVSDGAGGAIVTWYDHRSGTDDDIYAQRVSAAGVPLWTANGVAICTAMFSQAPARIAPDGAGGAIVTWMDYRRGFAFDDVYAQRVNAAGVPQWTANGVALCIAPSGAFLPAITPDGAGGAIVAWEDLRDGNYDIYAQRVSAAGVPLWTTNGVRLCAAPNSQEYPAVTSDGAGGVIAAWWDFRSGSDYDIYAQRVNAAGLLQWTLTGAAICTASGGQQHPMIVTDGAGGAIVTWDDLRSGIDNDIYAQRVNATGVPLWTTNGVALCTTTGDQAYPTIERDGAGGAIVTWEDFRSGADYDIYAQRLNAAGVPQWTGDGVAISTSGAQQLYPVLASNGASGAIVAWADFRDFASFDIYAQNVNADGTLGGSLLSVPPSSTGAGFALGGVQPNPSSGELRVSFSLFDGTPATLELYDLTGRRIVSRYLGSLGPGAHVTSLTRPLPSMPPGIYDVSLTQGGRRAFRKVAIVR